jgi:glutamate dehydrogenase/leucine dehydrogenase
LKADFALEPQAKDRLVRARAALSAEVVWKGEVAEVPLGGGKAVRLVREGGAFKVAALE